MVAPRVCLLFCLLLSGYASAAHGQPADAVALVLADMRDGTSSLGSGFFISTDGRLLTPYHLVAGATRIRLIAASLWTDDVLVQAVAPHRDLAVLRLAVPRARTPFIPLAVDAAPDALAKAALDLVGYHITVSSAPPSFPVRLTSARSVASTARRSEAPGRRLVAPGDLELMPLDAAVDSRFAGSPVVWNGTAIGMALGSMDPAAKASAVPAKYMVDLSPINRPPARIETWPLAALQSPALAARSRARLEPELLAALDALGRFVEGKVALQGRAMSELTALGHQAIERCRRAVDVAVFRHGTKRRVEEIALDADEEIDQALNAYATRHRYYESQFAALDAAGVAARLAQALERHVARLRGAPRREQAWNDVLSQVRALARPDAVDTQRAARVTVFESLAAGLDAAQVLEDLQRSVDGANASFRTLLDAYQQANVASAPLLTARNALHLLFEGR